MRTRTLHLLRHAKSSWKLPTLADEERPLNGRGRRAADALRGYLAGAQILPDLVLCSTARRARQTFERATAGMALPKVVLDRALYEAGALQLLKYLRGVADEARSVLIVGHNPAIQELALSLADAESTAKLPPVDGKFPTGALASFQFEGSWSSLPTQGARLVAFVIPKDLT